MAGTYRAELTGLFGDPVDGNPTGAVEEAAFAALGLNYRYITCRVGARSLPDAVKGMRAIGMKGVNLTMPHKVEVIPYLDELTRAAALIGAVNTVYLRDGKYVGENTDGKGFLLALEKEGVSVGGKTIALLGAGGAARAVAMECLLAGAERIHVINRTGSRGEGLRDALNRQRSGAAEFHPWEGAARIPSATQVLVNCTSVGLHPYGHEKPLIDYGSVGEGMCVCDVVFNPADTLFLQAAALRGAKTVTGLGMLANQAAMNFALWTDREAPLALMEQTLREALTTAP